MEGGGGKVTFRNPFQGQVSQFFIIVERWLKEAASFHGTVDTLQKRCVDFFSRGRFGAFLCVGERGGGRRREGGRRPAERRSLNARPRNNLYGK